MIQSAGRDHQGGAKFSYADEYKWSGFTARETIFAFLKDAMDKNRRLDAFAYDLNEPNVIAALAEFAKAGRLRLILDDAGLHHAAAPKDKWEDKAEAHLNAAGAGSVMRGKFGSYSHDKVFIAHDGDSH